ncbi:MFS transporter [Hyphomicrobium sp. D-2]|uniref:MFS transporter n=1 Tax=Hyphomicrobium sp. D-2 TaxID=3041621 RepID=UPI0024543356|nr:MFS transporter [Hyphomicrobium sp. D-2]MDH4981435.1 MFS transporter [Hyphomicrobium sp. D-2]
MTASSGDDRARSVSKPDAGAVRIAADRPESVAAAAVASQTEMQPQMSGAMALSLRISAMFGALFLAYGVVVPYFPVWLDARGLDPLQISTVVSAPLFIRLLVTPGVGLLADRLGNYRLVITVLASLALSMLLVLTVASGYGPILIIGVAFLLANGTIMPLVETVAVRAVRAEKLDYGRMRLWGSVTFIVANFGGGIAIEAWGGDVALWLMIVASTVTIAAALMLPRTPASPVQPVVARSTPSPTEQAQTEQATHTASAVCATAGEGHGATARDWRQTAPARLLKSRLFVLFLIAIGCIHGAHATFYTFGALYWQSQGMPAAWVGALWAIAVSAEVLLFAYSAPFVRRIGSAGLIVTGAAAAVVRWTAMAFDPPLAILVPLQALHALTYGASHLGAILFIARAVPHKGMGSAQAFYSTMAAGLMVGTVGLVSGALYTQLGGQVFVIPAVVAAFGLIAALLLLRGWNGHPLWDDGADRGRV